jgi:4'-phosphopantetheinyl transferase
MDRHASAQRTAAHGSVVGGEMPSVPTNGTCAQPQDTPTCDHVHLWAASLDDIAAADAFVALLSAREHDRAMRFRFVEDRTRFILRRAMLRQILGAYLSVDPARIELTSGPYGKPAIDTTQHRTSLQFSASHSHGRALVAVVAGSAIGVDIEVVRLQPDANSLLQQFGTERERATYREASDERRPEVFAIWWTRKEAFLKATGTGLAFSLRSFDVAEPRVRVGEAGREYQTTWSLVTLSPVQDCIGSVCVEGPPGTVLCRHWVFPIRPAG